MTKRILVALFAALLLATQVHADDASHRQACEDLMKLFNIDKMLVPVFKQVAKMQEDRIAKMQIPDDMKDVSKKYLDRINELVMKNMSWKELKDDVVRIYMEVFTETEIRELLGFYESPIGKKFVQKSPELALKVVNMSQARTMKILPEIEKLTKEMEEELKRKQRKDN